MHLMDGFELLRDFQIDFLLAKIQNPDSNLTLPEGPPEDPDDSMPSQPEYKKLSQPTVAMNADLAETQITGLTNNAAPLILKVVEHLLIMVKPLFVDLPAAHSGITIAPTKNTPTQFEPVPMSLSQ